MIDGKKWNNVFKSRIDVYYNEKANLQKAGDILNEINELIKSFNKS